MAVYTHLSADNLAGLIAEYDVGELVSAKGIAEGVSNSNWLIETTGQNGSGGRFILTMYEHRVEMDDLPFFLGLLDHLSAKGSPVPRTIHDRDGAASRSIDGKAVALIEFLPGVSIDTPRPAQTRAVGEALAGIFLSGYAGLVVPVVGLGAATLAVSMSAALIGFAVIVVVIAVIGSVVFLRSAAPRES